VAGEQEEERERKEERDRERELIRAALGEVMRRGVREGWAEEAFSNLTLRIFRYQVQSNPVYGAFVRNRGVDPETLSDWSAIPPVPARAFKEVPLYCGDPALAAATFLTSGTTRGGEGRGRHPVRDLSLYRASLIPMAEAYLHPCGSPSRSPLRLIALLPDPQARPESSLVHMAGVLKADWDDGRGGFFASADWALDLEGVEAAMRGAVSDRTPVLLLGTAFAFVHWLDASAGRSLPSLPSGSVIMETGGYKGRSREVPRAELYASLSDRLGVPLGRIVNEYGMTEMLSQFYEPVLPGDAPAEVEGRWHVSPPWVRTRILNPNDLTPVPAGEPGLLCHYDLANLDSVSGILTEDWGVAAGSGFRVLGRLLDAEPRGCSLSLEELLTARGDGGG